MRKLFTLLIALFLWAGSSWGQVSLYSFASSSGTYTAITGGTVLRDGTLSMDSWASTAQTIPSFTFNGVAYTTAYVTSNGILTLGATAASSSSTTGISSTVGSGIALCPFSADLDRATTTAATNIRWETVGDEIIFQWTQVKRYGSANVENFDMQVRMNTLTGVVLFVYQLNTGPGTMTTYQPQVGIRTSATDYNNRLVASGAENWATSLQGVTNTSTCRFTSTAPAKGFTTGLTYTFTPPVIVTPPNCATIVSPAVAGTNVLSTATLNWASGGGAPTGYKLYFGAGSLPGTYTDLGNVTTFDPSPDMNYSTTYYWKVVPYNANGDATGCATWSFTTGADPTISTFPYTQAFEDLTFPPYGWNEVRTPVSSYGWTSYATGYTGKCARFDSYNNSAGNISNLYTPVINLTTLTTARLKFIFKNPTGGDFSVLLSTDGGATYPNVIWSGLTAQTGWLEKTADITSFIGNNVKIAFKGTSNWGSGDAYVYLDDIIIEEMPATPVFAATPATKDFGTVVLGASSASQIFSISNPGGGTLTIDPAISITGADAAHFTLTDANSYPLNLTAGQSATVGVSFAPATAGSKSANLTIVDNVGGGTTNNLPLTGACVDATITSLPHTQNFDGVTAPAFPTGWSGFVSSTSSLAVVNNSTSSPNSAPNNAYLYNYSDASADLRLVSPPISASLANARVKFYARSGAGHTIVVGTMNSPTGTFTARETVTVSATNALYSVSFAGFSGTDTYLAFKHGLGGTYRTQYIDDVVIEEIQAVPPDLASLSFPAEGLTTLNNPLLSWTPAATGEPATGYKVYLDATNPPTTEVYNGTATSFQTAGLNAGTDYFWKVVPYNANGNATGAGVWTFSTVPDGYLGESFESVTYPPAGWANAGTWSRSTSVYYHGLASSYKYTTATASLLRTPMVTIDGSSTLKFFAKTTTASTYQRIQIQSSPDGTNWTNVGTEISLLSAGPWALYSIDLSSLAGGNYYLAISTYYSTGGSGGSVYIDHVVGPEITPLTPAAVTLVSPADAATSVTTAPQLSWTPAASGGVPTGYKIYLDGNADPTTLFANVATSPYTVAPALNYSQTYYWKVVAYNGSGDGAASAIRSFTTMDDPTLIPPFTQEFATYPPTNWTEANGQLAAPTTLLGTMSNWTADGFASVGTTGAARLNIFSTGLYGWMFTPPINLGDGSVGYELRFKLALTAYNSATPAGTTGTDDKFAVVISTDNGTTWSSANTLKLWDNAGSPNVYNNIATAGETIIIDLSAYSGIVKIGFYGESTVSNADNDLSIDNVTVQEPPLIGTLSGTITDCYSSTALRNVNVTLGSKSTITDAVGYYEFTDIETGIYSITAALAGYVNKTVANVSVVAGANTEDFCMNQYLAPPVNLQGQVTGQDVALTWLGPGSTPESFSDSFESYTDFALSFPPWVNTDLDLSVTYGIQDVTFANSGYTGAFIAFNPNTTSPALGGNWLAHTGNKYAACFAATSPPNNDWLISPKVKIVTGSVLKFWAKSITATYGLERFRVGVSTAGTATTDFTIITAAPYIEAPIVWTEYTYDLSAYVGMDIYVTINCVSSDAFAFMVDDFSIGVPGGKSSSIASTDITKPFERVQASSRELLIRATGVATMSSAPSFVGQPLSFGLASKGTLTGYNVYRDGTKIGDNIADLFYNDLSLAGGTYSYEVSAQYTEGESEPIGPIDLEVITCAAPTGGFADNISTDGADLNWTENGSSTLWDIELVELGAPATGTPTYTDVAANPYPVSGLESGTSYSFYVRAKCDATNLSSWVGPFSFTTECIVYALPYSTDFTTVTCWTQGVEGTGVTNRWGTSSTSNAGGTAPELVCSYQNITGTSRLISPEINTVGMTSLLVSFQQMLNDYGQEATQCTFKLRSSSDGVNWTDEGFSYTSGDGDIVAENTEVIVVNNLGATTYLAWEVSGNLFDFDYWYIDNVQVNSIALPVVNTGGISNIMSTTASVDCEVVSDGGATVTRGVCWNSTGSPTIADSKTIDGTGTGVFTSNMTGLTAGTPYFVKAYATNALGTSYGTEETFTTLNAVTFNVDMSTAEGFDPATGSVYISGSFATWPEPGTNPAMMMTRVGVTNIFTITLSLSAGDIQYKYFDGAGWEGGEWSGAFSNRTLTVSGSSTQNDVFHGVIGWANLQWPTTATITVGGSETIYGQVFIDRGITEAAGATYGLTAEIGVSDANTDPATWLTWSAATFNTQSFNNDEFSAALGSTLTEGTYYYAYRYRFGGSAAYYYGGTGGAWSAGTSGVLTVNPAVTDKTLNLTSVLLEGLYAGGGTLNQAYDDLGPHFGPGVADMITVELHSSTDGDYSTIIYSVTDVPLSTTGSASVSIPAIYDGNFYITIRHRNSLQTVSATAVSFTGATISQSFGAPEDVFGANLVLMADMGYAIFGGDVNQDDILDSSDAAPVDNEAAMASSGYMPEDVNGDGLIDSSDASIIDNSAALAIGAITP